MRMPGTLPPCSSSASAWDTAPSPARRPEPGQGQGLLSQAQRSLHLPEESTLVLIGSCAFKQACGPSTRFNPKGETWALRPLRRRCPEKCGLMYLVQLLEQQLVKCKDCLTYRSSFTRFTLDPLIRSINVNQLARG